MLNYIHTKIKNFNSLICKFNSLIDNSSEDYNVNSRNKRQVLAALKAASNILETFFGILLPMKF
jgi:hypothetical protein